jgi:hypothetical protein
MHSPQRTRIPTNEVVALFADSSLSFRLSKGATFGDLADRLDRLGKRRKGTPAAVYLKVGIARRPTSSALHPGI